MNKIFLFPIWILLLVAACAEPPSDNERSLAEAKEAAEDSYKALLAGRYDDFISHRADHEELPATYRDQLVAAYKQYMARQEKEHGGIASFSVSGAHTDSTSNQIQVFLLLNYADSVHEEIVVPMVNDEGKWKMK